jgi:tetratricopeptide (TPR) repeat protein
MSAAVEPRPRLIAPGALVMVGLLVAGLLALLFPGLDFGQPEHLAHPDPLSAAYLRQVLRSRPGDRAARMLLAREELALGEWDAAHGELTWLAESADSMGWQARLDLLDLDRARLAAEGSRARDRAEREAEARAAVRRLAGAPFAAEVLGHLAEVALALEAPADAAGLYARLSIEDPAGGPRWARLAGRWYRATHRPEEAVRFFLLAAEQAPPPPAVTAGSAGPDTAGSEDMLEAVAVLRSEGQAGRALVILEQALQRHPDARDLLERGVELALAEADLPRAAQWGEALLQGAPDDDRLLERQLSVELGMARLPAAWNLVSRLVALHPDDAGLRARAAEIAGWAGRGGDALAAWLWLANHGSEEARTRAVALGRALFAYDQVVAALQTKARARTLSLAELLELADALEARGQPEAAEELMAAFSATFAQERDYWREATVLAEHVGDSEGALRGVRGQIERFGPGAVAPGREAQILWELDRPDEALSAARAEMAVATPDDVAFWRLLGNLAWTEEDETTALAAYRHLWMRIRTSRAPSASTRTASALVDVTGPGTAVQIAAGSGSRAARSAASPDPDQEVAERLISLLTAEGQMRAGIRAGDAPRELVAVASAASERFRSPSLLLTALDGLVEAERWREVRSLLAWAERTPGTFAEEPEYWAAVGRLAEAEGQAPLAIAAWSRVGRLRPGDPDAAEELHALRGEPNDVGPGAPDAGDQLARALERHDRSAVGALLAHHAGELTLAERVDGELALGNDGGAWRLLDGSGATPGGRDADPEDVAVLADQRRALAQERQSVLSAGGGLESLSSLGIVQQRASVVLGPGRLADLGRIGSVGSTGALAVRASVELSELRAASGAVLLALHENEARVGVGASYRETWGDSGVRVGAHAFGSGTVAFASATQHLEWTPRLTIDLDAIFHQLATDTAALRAAGLRNAVEGAVLWRPGARTAIDLAGGAHAYTARGGEWLGTGAMAHLELGQVLREAAPRLRVRADGFVEANRLAAELPVSVARAVQPGTPTDSVVPQTYETAGIGVTLTNVLGDEPDTEWDGTRDPWTRELRTGWARLRPYADLWAGWLMPAQKVTYTLAAGLGVAVARSQELAAAGFFESDRAGEPGERYMGVSVLYALRWW